MEHFDLSQIAFVEQQECLSFLEYQWPIFKKENRYELKETTPRLYLPSTPDFDDSLFGQWLKQNCPENLRQIYFCPISGALITTPLIISLNDGRTLRVQLSLEDSKLQFFLEPSIAQLNPHVDDQASLGARQEQRERWNKEYEVYWKQFVTIMSEGKYR